MARKTQTTIDRYTQARHAIESLKTKHEDVFSTLQSLEDVARAVEDELKAEVRTTGEITQNEFFIAKPTPSTKRWFDWATIKKLAKADELETIEKEAVVNVEVNAATMQRLVIESKIRPKIVQEAYKEEAMTTRVSITPVNQE